MKDFSYCFKLLYPPPYNGIYKIQTKIIFTNKNEVVHPVGHHLELGLDGEDGVVGNEPRLLYAPPAAHHPVVTQKHYLHKTLLYDKMSKCSMVVYSEVIFNIQYLIRLVHKKFIHDFRR